MKKILIVLLLLAATTTRGYADSGLWREAGQSCVFGGSVLGITSILVLYPAIAMGTNTIPVTSLILGNTLFGCGIAAIGASAAYGFGWAYDRVFGPEQPEAVKPAAPPTPAAPPAPAAAPPAASARPTPPSAVPPAARPPSVTPVPIPAPAVPAPGPVHSRFNGMSL
ncbi:exported hypothetical protein [Gammaproteobacteria bacterium]